MTLLHRGITFCNFDGTYEPQSELRSITPHKWIDFRNLRGTHLYCSPEAFTAISHKLANTELSGLTFLGSGNYHYATLALLQKIPQPFSLILFDHHTDLKEGRIGNLLSCGSWVRHALSDVANLKKVIIVGPDPPEDELKLLQGHYQVTLFPERSLPSAQRLISSIPTQAVYMSIDKDLISEQEAKTNWDQGHLSINRLAQLLATIIENKQVEGIDVCGEWPVQPHQELDQRTREWIRKNELCNLRIVHAYLNHLHSVDRRKMIHKGSSKHVM